ncbi:MAG: 23S rRNA (guanosine(2251)-2'-O)-methyltransferase RlmB [Syntrophales bacterium]|nr:23S rRNA (guanosine(2251)-2'-O)-methyltransferase RlmB [Syntrophales bacterium]
MQIIYGVNPVLESLQGDPKGIVKIIIAAGRKGPDTKKIITLASAYEIPVLFQDNTALERLTGRVSHQGVVGLCREQGYVSVDELIANRRPDMNGDLVLLVDGVTDPQNLGALIRTAHCFGANGVIIPSHRAAGVTPAVVKASAGAVRYIPLSMAVNIGKAIDYLKEKGYWIYGADAGAGQDLGATSFEGRIGLVVGSEGKGIRPLVREKCDFLFSIPMVGKIDSLNVSVASGIMLYTIFMALKRRS